MAALTAPRRSDHGIARRRAGVRSRVLTRALLLVVVGGVGVGCVTSPRPNATARTPSAIPAPTPPTPNPASAAPLDPCLAADPTDAMRRALDDALTDASDRLERPLCLTRVRPTSDDDARRTFDLEVLDRETDRRVLVRALLERRSGAWDASPFLVDRLIEDVGLEVLPEWLRRTTPRSIARQTLVADVTLVEVRDDDHTTVCLEHAERSLGCWREPGHVTRIVAWDWDFAIADPETHPFGRLAIERPHGVVFWAVRTEGGLARAHARPFVLPEDPRRPAWSRTVTPTSPESPVPRVGWRAIDVVEAPAVGPLRGLRIRSFGELIDARTALARRVCVRTDAWRCTAPEETRDSGHGLRESAIDDGGATTHGAWALASSRSDRGETADTGGRGDARLVLYETDGDRLVRRGEVVVGRVRWQTRADRRREVLRVWHPTTPRRDDCFAFAAAERFSGLTDFDFVPLQPAPSELVATSTDVIAWSPPGGDASEDVPDLHGAWRVEDDGLRRVTSCDEGRVALAPLEIEPALPPEVRACFERLARQVFAHPPFDRVSGLPCGAHEREAELVVHHRFVRDAAGRVIERHATGVTERDRFERVERDTWRGDRVVQTHVRRTHYLDEQLECEQRSRLRYEHDRRGRVVTTRWDGTACEGDPAPYVTRQRWNRVGSVDVSTEDHVATYVAPNGARATCGTLGCSCEVDARDLDGAVRVRLRVPPDDRASFTYDYVCE